MCEDAIPRMLILGGELADGSGSPRYKADVVIEGDRIVDVGRFENAEAQTVIEASGCLVAPGFVDMHSHADFSLPALPTADSLVHQGITSVVVGNCGHSPAPLRNETREDIIAGLPSFGFPLPWDQWSSFGSYLDYLTLTGISVNAVPLIGQGTVRSGVMGFVADSPNHAQIAEMQSVVRTAMDEGAIGVSTGLVYPPGSYAATEEIIALTRPVGERGGFYFSHIRGEDATLLEAIGEAVRISRETGAPVQISHLKASGRENWGKASRALELIDKARSEGLGVTADMYPYTAGCTSLVTLLPEWAQEGGKRATLGRLTGEVTRDRMKDEMHRSGFARIVEWDRALISNSPGKEEYEGRYVSELASDSGRSPYDWIFDALLETELEALVVLFTMSEDNIKLQLRHPAVMISTDGLGLAIEGPLAKGVPHPRSYGTYPRVLARYVREQGVIGLEEAIWKMSGLPAEKLRWADRGLVRRGYKADLVVLDPHSISDTATYAEPHQYPSGVQHVIVNGELVIHDGSHTQARPGRILGSS